MNQGGFVYILTNKRHTVLYIGVTATLPGRIDQHRTNAFPKSFTARYNVDKLVYFRTFPTIMDAIAEEKRLKSGSRQQKSDLINSINPAWIDLWETDVSKW